MADSGCYSCAGRIDLLNTLPEGRFVAARNAIQLRMSYGSELKHYLIRKHLKTVRLRTGQDQLIELRNRPLPLNHEGRGLASKKPVGMHLDHHLTRHDAEWGWDVELDLPGPRKDLG